MARLNQPRHRRIPTGPIAGAAEPAGRTHEGAPGYVRDAKSELYLTAVSTLHGEHNFYEGGAERAERYRGLVRRVTLTDPHWVVRFASWLRRDAHLRTAPLVTAAEFVHARHAGGVAEDSHARRERGLSRTIVDAVCLRGDEPAELLAYWLDHYGRSLPQPLKRGVADALARLGTEYNYIKYGGANRAVRWADALNLTHPARFRTETQRELFRHIVTPPSRRGAPHPTALPMLAQRAELLALPPVARRTILRHPDALRRGGITWEQLAGWLQGPLDADAWEAILPSLGYMAILRNLRNITQAGVGEPLCDWITAYLADPAQVAASRQLPLRFLAAYREANHPRWAWPLEQGLNHSLANVPRLPGRTLILVDRSASMFTPLSARSGVLRSDAAALFGTALAVRAESADLIQYGTHAEAVEFAPGEPVLPIVVERFANLGGTNTWGALRTTYGGHDRVIIVTDEQSADTYGRHYHPGGFPDTVPLYIWNLGGYQHGSAPSTARNYVFGGLSDAAFGLIPLLEAGQSGRWPWLNTPTGARHPPPVPCPR